MTGNEHLQEEAFRRGTRGRITFAEAMHLEACPECSAVVRDKYYDEAARNFIAALNYEPSDEDPPPDEAGDPARDESEVSPWLWLATAASVIICIAALIGAITLFRAPNAPAEEQHPAASVHGNPRWDDEVTEALEHGHVHPASPSLPQTSTTFTTVGFDNGPRTPLSPRQTAVLDAEAAHRLRPTDHLLLGVLYARAALPTDATRELTEYLRAHPNDPPAQRVLASLQVQ
jgi:hypothetical protein